MLSDKIILIGFMGSGKSSVGKELSKRLGIKLLDSDDCIEKQKQKSINDIFRDEGEESFRAMEWTLAKTGFLI